MKWWGLHTLKTQSIWGSCNIYDVIELMGPFIQLCLFSFDWDPFVRWWKPVVAPVALPPGTSWNRLSAASRILKSCWRTAACESYWSQTAAEKSRVGPGFQKWQKWAGDGWCLGEPLYTFLVIPGSRFWPTQEHKEPKKYRKTWTAELKMVEVRDDPDPDVSWQMWWRDRYFSIKCLENHLVTRCPKGCWAGMDGPIL